VSQPSRDYEEFIAGLNAHGVRYVVIGAHAVAFHARPRATKDLDLLVEPTPNNAERVLSALREFFGVEDVGYSLEDLTNPEWIIQIGVAPVRIDLLLELPGGPSFEEVWSSRVAGEFGGVPVSYVGIEELVRAKAAADRPQDRADIRTLRRLLHKRAD
jgi:predicted nucleotidyltransferase